MERIRFSVKGAKGMDRATVEYDGECLYLCAKGRKLMVSEGEVYDMITLFMSQYYQDFTEKAE
jgi:hypothetical protein